MTARVLDAASGFAEPLPQGWTAVDPSTATFEVTLPGGPLARTGGPPILPEAIAAAALTPGSWLLVIGRRRRSSS